MGKRATKILITTLLVISLLSCSFSVYAYDYSDRVTSQEYLWAYFIYEFLNSIGIQVSYKGIVEYTDEVQDTIIDWAVNYIADEIEADNMPSNYSIAKWVAPWQASYDYWGNLQYNSTMLEDLEDFARWLKHEFSLIDNQEVPVNPEYTLNGYTLYRTGQWYMVEPLNPNNTNINASNGVANITTPNGEQLFYTYVQWMDGYSIVFLTEHSWYAIVDFYASDTFEMNNGSKVATMNMSYFKVSDYGVYWTNSWQGYNSWLWKPVGGRHLFYGVSHEFSTEFGEFMKNSKIEYEGNVAILTSVIELPSDNPNYTIGDGVTIIDGEPQYGEIVFSGEITNLPAIVSTQDIDNPEIDQIYTNIPPLVEEAGNSMEIFRQIIFRMPDGVLIALYALLSAGVIFGFLRIMREH